MSKAIYVCVDGKLTSCDALNKYNMSELPTVEHIIRVKLNEEVKTKVHVFIRTVG